MPREFLELLEKAKGRSEYVIAINLDIRGFTPFCQTVESVDVATYVKKVYIKIIEDYFEEASFYKPTGDGLIVIIPYDEENLKEVANSTINSCLNLLEGFSSLCNGEPMITFPTPQKIGIGIARGSVCCIHADDRVFDYSGRILNLVSRLMDIARPSGIVLDGSFGLDLLAEDTKNLFSEETVYVRGVAEETPIGIYYTKEHTLIPDSFKQPIKEPRWETVEKKHKFGEFKDLTGSTFEIKLERKPLYNDKILVRIEYDNPKMEAFYQAFEYNFHEKEVSLRQVGNTYYVSLDRLSVVKTIEEDQVPDDAEVKIYAIYPVKW